MARRRRQKRKWGFKEELRRKAIHLASVLFLAVYVLFFSLYSHKVALMMLAALLIIMLELEFFRVEWSMKIPLISWLWKSRRTHEKHRLGGDVFFLIGAIICLSIFDIRVAAAAILMTTFGDMASALFGKAFGKTWVLKGRALEGIIPELVVNLVVGFFILRTYVEGEVWWLAGNGLSGDPIWSVIIVMAVVATAVETMITKLDDNLLVPVFSGFFGQVMLLYLTGGLF